MQIASEKRNAGSRFTEYIGNLLSDSVARNKVQEALHASMDSRTCDRSRLVLAETLLLSDRDVRRQIELAVQRSKFRRLQALEVDMYDETPLEVSRKDLVDLQPGSLLLSLTRCRPALAPLGDGEVVAIVPSTSNISPTTLRQMSKILQSRTFWSMLLQSPTGKYILVRGATLNFLQLLERTTGECTTRAEALRAADTSIWDECFDKILRVTILDGASSNPRAERGVRVGRGPRWHSVELACEDHLIFLVLKGAALLMKQDIAGQTHWSKAMTYNTARHHCRRLLKAIVSEWLVVREGCRPAHCNAVLQHLLILCLSTKVLETRLRLQWLPNGNPFKTGVIEVWVPTGTAAHIDRRELVDAVYGALDAVLLQRAIREINPHRWRGLYNGLGQAALFEGLWGVGPELLKRLSGAVRSMSNTAKAMRARSLGDDADYFETERHRSEALLWFDTRPLPRLIIHRMCLEAVRVLQEHHNDLCRLGRRQQDDIQQVFAKAQGLEGEALLDTLPFYRIISGDLAISQNPAAPPPERRKS